MGEGRRGNAVAMYDLVREQVCIEHKRQENMLAKIVSAHANAETRGQRPAGRRTDAEDESDFRGSLRRLWILWCRLSRRNIYYRTTVR